MAPALCGKAHQGHEIFHQTNLIFAPSERTSGGIFDSSINHATHRRRPHGAAGFNRSQTRNASELGGRRVDLLPKVSIRSQSRNASEQHFKQNADKFFVSIRSQSRNASERVQPPGHQQPAGRFNPLPIAECLRTELRTTTLPRRQVSIRSQSRNASEPSMWVRAPGLYMFQSAPNRGMPPNIEIEKGRFTMAQKKVSIRSQSRNASEHQSKGHGDRFRLILPIKFQSAPNRGMPPNGYCDAFDICTQRSFNPLPIAECLRTYRLEPLDANSFLARISTG